MLCTMFAALGFFTSCEKKQADPDASILGKWKIIDIGYNFYEDGKLVGTESFGDDGTFYEFKADGVLVISDAQEYEESTTWKMESGLLILGAGGDGEKLQISKLTDSDLEMATYFPPAYRDYVSVYYIGVRVK